MIERRRQMRAPTLLGGRLVFGRNLFSVACTVDDLSADGARLRLPPGVAIPDQFGLTITHAGEQPRARVVWRIGDHAGVTFQGDPVGDCFSTPGARATSRPGPLRRTRDELQWMCFEALGDLPGFEDLLVGDLEIRDEAAGRADTWRLVTPEPFAARLERPWAARRLDGLRERYRVAAA